MSRITFIETSPSGSPLKTYIITPSSSSTSAPKDKRERINNFSTGRADLITRDASGEGPLTTSTSATWSTLLHRPRLLLHSLLAPFLPTGYPDSVSPDYTSYQLYDSLQAIFSSIAGLLASRAVLTTLGVGSASATTSLALYLSILQNTISNLSSILFAHRFATSIAKEVKFYRFFADIVNDIAFVLDVLSPSLPVWARVPALCAASACRSVCGVAGGASKAVLSAHFAVRGNIGEVNAKDGSQETVVGLVGMWVGGLVVGRVEGVGATWCWLGVLLGGHLWANWCAVRSVRLRTLDGGRAGMVVERSLEGTDVGVEAVGKEEALFARRHFVRARGVVIGSWCVCGVKELLEGVGWQAQAGGRAYSGDVSLLRSLVEVFENQDYLLWWDRSRCRCLIALKAADGGDAVCETQLKALCHAWLIAIFEVDGEVRSKAPTDLDIIRRTLTRNDLDWPGHLATIRQGGWDLNVSALDAESGSRIQVQIE